MRNVFVMVLGIGFLALAMSFAYPNKKKKKVASPPGMVYVPSGKLLEYENKEVKSLDVKGFFMADVEVTNLSYKEFLADLGRDGESEALEMARIQDEEWVSESEELEPLKEYYSSHVAYEDYPVVNVSRAAAELYCKWLSEKWESMEKKPKGLEMVQLEFRLPTKEEWMFAAKGGHDLAPYPWGGYYLRNAKGQFLANFRRVGENNIKFNRKTGEFEVLLDKDASRVGKAGQLNDAMYFSAPSRSYFPNDYGLYNMSGNVSEMLHDEGTKGGSWGSTGYYVQIDAEEEFPDLNGAASKYVGFRPVAVIKK